MQGLRTIVIYSWYFTGGLRKWVEEKEIIKHGKKEVYPM